MKYKLIAVDLDGTLYNDQLKITSDTLNAMILVFFMPEIY